MGQAAEAQEQDRKARARRALEGRDRETRATLEGVIWLAQVTLRKLDKDGPR